MPIRTLPTHTSSWSRWAPWLLLLAAGGGLIIAGLSYVMAASLSGADPERLGQWQRIALLYVVLGGTALMLLALAVLLLFQAPPHRGLSVQVALAAGLLSLGIAKLVSHAFLLAWAVAASGHSDIAARGIGLLNLFLPHIAGGALLTTMLVLSVLTRSTRRSWLLRHLPAFFGASVGALLIYGGADPAALAMRQLTWTSPGWLLLTSLILASLFTIGGVLLGRRATRRATAAPITA